MEYAYNGFPELDIAWIGLLVYCQRGQSLGQHNFEFRSVVRFQRKYGWAGLSSFFPYFRGYKCWKVKIKMKRVSFYILDKDE